MESAACSSTSSATSDNWCTIYAVSRAGSKRHSPQHGFPSQHQGGLIGERPTSGRGPTTRLTTSIALSTFALLPPLTHTSLKSCRIAHSPSSQPLAHPSLPSRMCVGQASSLICRTNWKQLPTPTRNEGYLVETSRPRLTVSTLRSAPPRAPVSPKAPSSGFASCLHHITSSDSTPIPFDFFDHAAYDIRGSRLPAPLLRQSLQARDIIHLLVPVHHKSLSGDVLVLFPPRPISGWSNRQAMGFQPSSLATHYPPPDRGRGGVA